MEGPKGQVKGTEPKEQQDETKPEEPEQPKPKRKVKKVRQPCKPEVDLESALIGVLDASVAEQVKAESGRRKRKQVERYTEPIKKKSSVSVITPEPVTKLEENPPSDDQLEEKELRTKVENIVQNADLRKITMKMMVEKVFEAFPEMDKKKKRPLIKSIIKEVVGSTPTVR